MKLFVAGVAAVFANWSCILSKNVSRWLITFPSTSIWGTLGMAHCLIQLVPSQGLRDFTISSTLQAKYSFMAILHWCKKSPRFCCVGVTLYLCLASQQFSFHHLLYCVRPGLENLSQALVMLSMNCLAWSEGSGAVHVGKASKMAKIKCSSSSNLVGI